MNILLIVSLFVGLFSWSVGIAQARNFEAAYAGAVTSTEIDLGGDEETAREGVGTGRGSLIGSFVFHQVRESTDLPPGDPNSQCANDEIERLDVHFTIIFTDQRGRNQLFFRLAQDQDSFICIDPSNPPKGERMRRHNFDVVGGSGRFEKASGQVVTVCSGARLARALTERGPAHGSEFCEMSGDIQLNR